MPFTGKATFTAGQSLPELVEDVSDLVSIVSPHETPLLDYLGDGAASAINTVHEWVEDALLPNTDRLNQTVFSPNPTDATTLTVENGNRFRPGDQIAPGAAPEVMLVNAIAGNQISVTRGYGNTPRTILSDGITLNILGNASLEGDDRPPTRFTNRARKQNYTQIFTAGVEVSGSMQAARAHGVVDEMDYQKTLRLRELMRDLENCVINGVAPGASPAGSATVRRTMNGIFPQIQTNIFEPDNGILPPGTGLDNNTLTEPMLNAALREVWTNTSGAVDTILVGGAQKRRINEFVSSQRRYTPTDNRFTDAVSIYESDFGICSVILSRWVPANTVLLLDSSRLSVVPLTGRSFQFKPLSANGDAQVGMVVGEYTLEMRNENAHAAIVKLSA